MTPTRALIQPTQSGVYQKKNKVAINETGIKDDEYEFRYLGAKVCKDGDSIKSPEKQTI